MIDDLSSGRAERVAAAATLEVTDISDRAALDRVIDLAKPRAIFHLGAQSSVTVSVADPRRDCEVNVAGTLNVLEAARRHEAPVVFTSTGGALYGNDAPMPTPEDFIPAPLAPYGASKWAGESYVTTWTRAHGVPHAVCRLGNVYGPRQSPHGEAGVVAIFSLRIWRGEQPTLLRRRRADARLRPRRRRGAGAADGTRPRRRLQHRDRRRDRRQDALLRAAGGGGHVASAAVGAAASGRAAAQLHGPLARPRDVRLARPRSPSAKGCVPPTMHSFRSSPPKRRRRRSRLESRRASRPARPLDLWGL